MQAGVLRAANGRACGADRSVIARRLLFSTERCRFPDAWRFRVLRWLAEPTLSTQLAKREQANTQLLNALILSKVATNR